jgi:energy-coupling factor transporter ATP-binding protein EcfA2
MDLNAIIPAEIAAINRTFAEHLGPNKAGTCAKWTVVAGTSYITYGVGRGPGVGVDAVTKLAPELSEALSALRHKRTPVRLRSMPQALEVDHPAPAPLPWSRARVLLRHDVMLTGRNYSDGEPRDDTLSLDDSPHVLIAGTTGSGKSTLLRMMVATLALNTDPDMLRLYLVDLKNEDLLPLMRLPHVEATAVTPEQARKMVREVQALKNERVLEGKTKGPRVVLVIDELAQLADAGALDALGDVLSIGRSKRINVICATQKPTVEVVGKLGKANLTTRFVGKVTTSNEAVTAAGRGETFAHLLPGKGAFLRIEGANVTRLQAYWLDDNGTAELVKAARQRWGERDGVVSDRAVQAVTRVVLPEVAEPVITGYNQGIAVDWPVPGQNMPPAVTGAPVTFPLPRNRPPSQAEVLALRQLYAETRSKNEVLRVAYGAKNGLLLGYVNQALSEGGAA